MHILDGNFLPFFVLNVLIEKSSSIYIFSTQKLYTLRGEMGNSKKLFPCHFFIKQTRLYKIQLFILANIHVIPTNMLQFTSQVAFDLFLFLMAFVLNFLFEWV